MQCCGQEVKTPFCPMCGNKEILLPAYIVGLIAHIKKHIGEEMAILERYNMENVGTCRVTHELYVWRCRESALITLIEKAAKWDEVQQEKP